MPKERRKRNEIHEPSVKLKRTFAIPDNAVEHVEIGQAIEIPGAEVLKDLMTAKPQGVVKKKEKYQLKREAFLQRLETTNSQHSKSHTRRMKRKAKEQIASGLSDMQTTIAALDEALNVSGQVSADSTSSNQLKTSVKPGMIGEGKNVTLSISQRKHALQMEKIRHPLILSNPDFTSNPFQTIRTHAQNTLLKRQVPTLP